MLFTALAVTLKQLEGKKRACVWYTGTGQNLKYYRFIPLFQVDFWFSNNGAVFAYSPAGIRCNPKADKEPRLALQLGVWDRIDLR